MSQTPPPPGPGQPERPDQPPSGPGPYGENPYGQQNPYGQNPDSQNPYGQNPYNQQTPYGQAPYGQVPYGQNPYGPGPGAPEQGKGLAIAALVLAFVPMCVTQIAAIVMGIVVLAGRRAGKGLAIAAIVVAVVVSVAIFAGLAVLGSSVAGVPVDDLERGQCIDAEGLTDDESDSVSRIQVVDCTEPHDGEVLSTSELSAEEADTFRMLTIEELCRPDVPDEVVLALPENVEVTSLTQSQTPEEGDRLLCVAYPNDGSKLTEPLG